MEEPPLAGLLKYVAKIELHAHLNGSLKLTSILELGEKLYGENTPEFIKLSQSLIDFNGLDLEACFQKFKFMHDLTSTEKGLKLATEMVIRDFVQDNVIYLELRTTPKKTNESMTKSEYLKIVLDTIQNAEETLNIIIKLLPSIDRSMSIEDAKETVDLVLKLREDSEKYKQLIPGIDFSGNPYRGEFNEFKPVLEKARQNGLKLAIHCAEIDNREEIEEMLAFKMDRCGHGTFLNSKQIDELVKEKTAIECCLTSNVKGGTVSNFNDHHLKNFINLKTEDEKQAMAVLCTDDCGIFDTTLTNELEIVAKTFNVSKEQLAKLQLNAIDHAFTSSEEKQILRNVFYRTCINWNCLNVSKPWTPIEIPDLYDWARKLRHLVPENK